MIKKRKKPVKAPPAAKPLAPTTDEGKKAWQSVLNHGFPTFPRPTDEADPLSFRVLPDKLASLHADDLANEMGYWTAMQSYATEQAALVWNDLEANKRRLERLIDARIASGLGDTVTEKKARARQNPEVQALQERVNHLQSVYNLIDAIRGNCERNYAAISRVVSTRETAVE